MPGRFRHIAYSLLALALMQGSPSSRRPDSIAIRGNTMGTTYHITYFDKAGRNFKHDVDSLLETINRSISNYDTSSEVSRFNREERGIAFDLPYLKEPLRVASEVYVASEGALDLTVMPLVNAWGFGPGLALEMTQQRVDSIRQFVGFDKVQVIADSVVKQDPRVQIDLGGVGQGYGADVLARFLRDNGLSDYLVELGGEGVAAGRNRKTNRPWRIGILDPGSTLDNQYFKAYVSLPEGAFTTAGSYFNYREINGKRYSHTIDPVTGYPADRALLSVSVFAADCLTADAWDTAFMVMGHEKAIALLGKHPELQALLLYTTEDGSIASYATPGIAKVISYEP
ncbi:MAG TPA: FAD:protein FMN transferase [Chryseolinea sp.]|nr:FAD:protein FMN transferase [Chryseolinea sp.]